MTDLLPYWAPASNAGQTFRGYLGTGKHSMGLVPYPEPQMDWEVLREAKLRCEQRCAGFNNLMGSCRFAMPPSMSCHRFRPHCVSGVLREPDKELVYLMRQSADGTTG